ncbi:hypothetical protein DKG34_29085 [Streptomyces sp. NWU49]|uniref:Uncharacterized protein n=2 Tax=Streptomyces viridosporus TaxID=67581 RepID=A0ABX6AAU6_STRVD|nr:predicted protein [Streptomyces viridosporus ATCC 14672]PWJ04262.1 hypothetical protein DKG34_29085 [Streptomyces sp. NWU49]QEU84858.1 hypothetical protein CP969_09220 [Streptomyces viridosporus T7A]
MGCHGPHLLQGELDASRPYLGGCRLKPLDHKDGRGVSDLHPCALPHARGIPTENDRNPVTGRVDMFNTRRSWPDSRPVRRRKRQER